MPSALSGWQSVFVWLWIPLNLWIVWRLCRGYRPGGYEVRTRRYTVGQAVGALSFAALLVLAPPSGAAEALILLTVACVAGRSVMVLLDFWQLGQTVAEAESVWAAILRQRNLQRIQEARAMIALVFLFVIFESLGSLMRGSEASRTVQTVAIASLLLLILAFLGVILQVSQKHRREARQLMLSGGVTDLASLESGLASLANRSTAANLIVREVFMSEVFRIALTVVFAVASRL